VQRDYRRLRRGLGEDRADKVISDEKTKEIAPVQRRVVRRSLER